MLVPLLLLLAALVAAPRPAAAFVTFDSGHVRPLALSPDGTRLFAVDTPDNRLEIFSVDGTTGNLTHSATVPVGLEPVAVAARTDTEVWVVNHLSDSVSIVDLSGAQPRVVRTLLVGDEPRDIVFTNPVVGTFRTRAFITCAHRGQNNPNDPQLTTGGVDRADVWAFDALTLGTSLGGDHFPIITLFGDTPRALAVSTDGDTVYAAVFHSGNQTTALDEGVICNDTNGTFNVVAGPCTVSGVSYPGGLPNPDTADNTKGPETGLVVKFDGVHWLDRSSRNWDNAVRFFVPDDDVFRIDASTNPAPVAKTSSPHAGQPFQHVGTVLFNMAVNPVSGKVYVTNGDAHNEVRFEGLRPPCTPLPNTTTVPSSVVGHLSESRITVLDPISGSVTPRHLNSHLDSGASNYCNVPSPAGTAAKSLATPLGMAVTSNGSTLYVAAFGSSDPLNPGTTGKVGVFDTGQLEGGTFTPSAASHIVLSGGGASSVLLNETKNRLYVTTRFDNAVSVVDITNGPGSEVQHLPVHNPEPAIVKNGRKFLYDATLTSSNGEAACASCHIFADFDSLAWDLGDPGGTVLSNPNPFRLTIGENTDFHPLKGPMTTQTLRGMVNNGPMHWRGDRTEGNNAPPNNDPLDSNGAFLKFNVAFVGLLGRNAQLTGTQMQAFTDFILEVTLPPNPIRALDNSLTQPNPQNVHQLNQKIGRDFFMGPVSDVVQPCHGCHQLNPALSEFGTDGFSTFENETQDFKIPHLRNLYQKVGMFGMPAAPFVNVGNNGSPGGFLSQPHQVRGFGFLHDGSVDTLFRFHNATVFNAGFNPNQNFCNQQPPNNEFCGITPDELRRDVEQFMLAFDSDLAPIVGQQVTLNSTNGATVDARINLMIARATQPTPECELTVKGVIKNTNTNVLEQRGAFLRTSGPDSGKFQTDRHAILLTATQVHNLAATPGQEITYTCVPPGDGQRVGVDRDLDGFFDRDELDQGSDPADPLSTPGGGTTTTSTSTTTITAPSSTTSTTLQIVTIQTHLLNLRDDSTPPPNPARRKLSFKSLTKFEAPAHRIVVPLENSGDDPTLFGATLVVYNSNGSGEKVTVSLPPSDASGSAWSKMGSGANFKGYRYRGKSPNGPISQVRVQADKIVVKGGKTNWAYTLNEFSQGRIAVQLTLGLGRNWCADAPAKASGSPPSTAGNDKVDKFVAQPKTPAPAVCPPIP